MSRNSKRNSRGFTLSEVLTSMVILALMTTFVVVIINPILKAPSQEQAKADTLQAATQGLYQIQRDLRMSDTTGVYSCSASGGAYSCSQPSSLQSTSYLVLASPVTGGQLSWDTSGALTLGLPLWQGAVVYWLQANTTGSKDLKRAFVGTALIGSLGSGPISVGSSLFGTAVGDAVTAGGPTVAHNVQTLSVSVNSVQHVVGLKIQALASDNNATNSTTYTSSTFTRN